jgi:hypothetical protein
VGLPQPNDIDVICVACGARVRIRRGRVGRVYKCPKCTEVLNIGKSWDEAVAELLAGPAPVVQPPAPLPGIAAQSQSATPGSDDEYRVLPGVDQPSPGSTAYSKYFPVLCPLCHTRMYATEAQVGEKLECPDCRRSVVVPPAPPPKPKPKRWSEDDGKEVPLGAACDRETAFEAVKSRIELHPRDMPEHEDAPLPEWPLVKGVFSFPGYFTVWPRWIAYSIWLAVVLVLVNLSINLLINGMANGINGAGMAMAAVICIMLSSISGGSLWLGFSGLLLSVLEDTSDGVDKIENWPETIFSNLRASYFTFNALIFSALPGVALGSLFVSGGEPHGWLAAPASVVIFFPFVLLSMLAHDSPMIPIERMVWRSLTSARSAWVGFYVESFLVLGLGGAAAVFAWRRGGIPILSLAAVVIVAALLIYFRMLGRLGWISATQAVEDEEDEAAEEEPAAHSALR